MKKEQIGFLVTLVLGGSAAYYFLVYKPNNITTAKANYVNNIANKIGTDSVKLNTFDTAFLQAWSNALDTNSSVFIYNGRKYDGYYGTAIV